MQEATLTQDDLDVALGRGEDEGERVGGTQRENSLVACAAGRRLHSGEEAFDLFAGSALGESM